jgi:hypothetical protein
MRKNLDGQRKECPTRRRAVAFYILMRKGNTALIAEVTKYQGDE